MSYEIVIYDAAESDLQKCDKVTVRRLVRKLEALQDNPQHFLERLEGRPLWKLRVGDYRAIIDLDDAHHLIRVVLIGHRQRVYQELRRRL